MTTVPVRLARGVMWLALIILVLAAFAISGLRFFLPHLNEYREPIRQWVSQQAEMRLEVARVEGHWRNRGPSLVLQGVEIAASDKLASIVHVGDVEMQLDIPGSLWAWQPVFKDVRLSRLSLDLTQLPASIFPPLSEPAPATSADADSAELIARLETLFFVQLGKFSLKDSHVTLISPAGQPLRVDINALKWDATGVQHRAEGVISVADTHFSQLQVIANLSASHSFPDLSGRVYVQARNLSVTPWLDKQLGNAEVTGSNLNAALWLNLQDGKLADSLLRLENSALRWQRDGQSHQFQIQHGLLALKPQTERGEPGWRIDSEPIVLQTDGQPWPAFTIAGQWHPSDWQLAISRLPLAPILPFASFLPPDSQSAAALDALQPSGQLQDIRLAAASGQSPRFSAQLEQLGLKQWSLLPEVHKLDATVAGTLNAGKAVLSLQDDELPYGDVFQAPLPIEKGDVTAYWQVGEDGWRLWSDHLAVTTPDARAKGQFRLDFPADAPAWLSFYGEAAVHHAGEAWRYLPTRALGRELTDYLSAAIRGGTTDQAQLMWYGELADFPYQRHEGIFQVQVPLEQGRFSFDTHWPELTDLALDLSFENDRMLIAASQARTMGAMASRVRGEAELAPDGHLRLTLDVAAEGQAIRDYMLATPLVDTVGAALTTVQVSGPVTSRFALDIPFDGSEVRAWGQAELAGNTIVMDTPPLQLAQVSGALSFDNDQVQAEGIQGMLLAQPVSVSFTGRQAEAGYQVGIDVDGHWSVAALQRQVRDPLLERVEGLSRWQANIGVDLHDTGFTYQVKAKADLNDVHSELPYPLALVRGNRQSATLSARGNAEQLEATLRVPKAAYRTRIELGAPLSITASHLSVGAGQLRGLQAGKHRVDWVSRSLDADRWIALGEEIAARESEGDSGMPALPLPTEVNAQLKKLKLATLNWHEVDLAVRKQPTRWRLLLDSREMSGEGIWPNGKPLQLALDQLHLNLPMLETEETSVPAPYVPQRVIPAATDFDRALMANLPEVDLQLADAWLQGYRLGEVSGKLRREGTTLALQNFQVASDATLLSLDGHWTLDGDQNETQIAFDIEGENSSELMARLGISGGIQGAEFSSYASIQWRGAPWSMHRETLSGEVKTETGKGVISEIGGAGRILGLFSLDSIIRKMQLDFSGVFDDGLAFNYIRGSGTLENGRFETDDIQMQALAGDMYITGSANLVSETVDAKVQFFPDFTSGIPVLTAFAVAPQTAILVFAISTALSPVLDVFTQVNYEVKGPIEAPVVTEKSRFTGEYTVPDDIRE
ncbi:YhdP family protein [Photobacterium atrarenae]|uniref:TIGR02099 family protein n=1 Tax=Photobacterium atrarenae TaxID=865757 RepID=A0ABY5GFS3_9GAMM|nr:YhdP family protein [Photobacterium atrarenae]UTV28036.1 TIGR02099 family protein [Photobacterium atrarenae]